MSRAGCSRVGAAPRGAGAPGPAQPRRATGARRVAEPHRRVLRREVAGRLGGFDAPHHLLDAHEARRVGTGGGARRDDEGLLEVEEADEDIASVTTNGRERSWRGSAPG